MTNKKEIKKTGAKKKGNPKERSAPKVKKTKAKSKSSKKDKDSEDDGSGIIVIEEDFQIDKEKEFEERKAYLEEARSQEAFD